MRESIAGERNSVNSGGIHLWAMLADRLRRRSLRRSGAGTKKIGGLRVVAFSGEGEARLAIVGGGIGIGTVGQEEFQNFDVAVRSGGEQRRVSGAVPIIGIETAIEEPTNGLRVTGSDGGGKGVVARAVRGGGMDVGAPVSEITSDFEMTEEAGEREDGEAVRRKRFGDGGIGIDKVANAGQVAGARGFIEIHDGAGSEEKVADLGTAGVDGEEERRGSGFVARGEERGIGREERADLRGVSRADGVEEGFCVGHSGRKGSTEKVGSQ